MRVVRALTGSNCVHKADRTKKQKKNFLQILTEIPPPSVQSETTSAINFGVFGGGGGGFYGWICEQCIMHEMCYSKAQKTFESPEYMLCLDEQMSIQINRNKTFAIF